jgi:hypothetical protein
MVAAQMVQEARQYESRKSLAMAMGVPRHVLDRVQRGSIPTPAYARRIAAYFGKRPIELWYAEPIQTGESR